MNSVATLEPPADVVGRERELAILRDFLAAALAGRGHIVLLSGEAGMGKTTLADTLCRWAAAAGARVAIGHCYDRTETPPYGPWVDSFAHLDVAGHGETLPKFASPRPAVALNRDAFFADMRAHVLALVAAAPLVLVLEDMHWADTASLDLLRFFAQGVRSLPLLLVVTYRADELNRRHPLTEAIPLLVREGAAERLHLGPLGVAEVRTLVETRYDLPDDDGARLAAYLVQRTEGNALFIAELLRTLEEERSLRHDGARWRVQNLAEVPLPHLLRQIVDARLTRLGDVADALLAVAAVIGQEVPFPVWRAVTPVDEETLVALVERAEEAHLLTAWPTGDGFRFSHALIREVLYENVPPLRRRRIHGQIGDAFAALPPADPDTVAYHYRQAGHERAVAWLVRAGERAEGAYALVTAAERYEAAFILLDAQGGDAAERGWLRLLAASLRRYGDPPRALAWAEEAAHLAAEGKDESLVARAQAVRGLLYSNRGEMRAAIAYLRAAADAVDRLPPAAAAAARRREEHIDRIANRGTLIECLAFAGRMTEARTQGERYLAAVAGVARTPAAVGALADVHSALALAYAVQGEPEASRRSFAAAIAACEEIGYPLTALFERNGELALAVLPYGADDAAGRDRAADATEAAARRLRDAGAQGDADDPRFFRLPVLAVEGRWHEAREVGETSHTISHVDVLHTRNVVLGWLAYHQGEPERAWRYVRDIWPRGPEIGPDARVAPFAPPLLRLAASLALDAGDNAAARAWLDVHRRWLDFMDATLGRAEEQSLEARWHREAGDMARARTHVEEAVRRAIAPRQPLALLEAHRLAGELAVEGGRLAEAETHLDAALTLAEACRAPYERALVLIARAELLAARGDRERGQASLDEATALCLPLGAIPALARIDAIAAGLAGAAARPTDLPANLSPREAEVLRLLAAGMSTARIGDHLSLSPRTVKVHIANIYAKIGVHTRAAATQFAIAHGLG